MFLSESEAKTTAYKFSKFRRKINTWEKTGKWPLFAEFFNFQQIKLEKNGFHSLKERQSSFHTL